METCKNSSQVISNNQAFRSEDVMEEIIATFQLVDKNNSGKITADELREALSNAQGQKFSENCCKLMIALFDRNKDGTIDLEEFQKLYVYINQWITVFYLFDKDKSGFIEETELALALKRMGYSFSSQFSNFLIEQNNGRIKIDEFIIICVQILRFTEAFRLRDNETKGIATFDFEDFVKIFFELSMI